MKKWFFFLFASMFLCSCSCLLSQIPPQQIYAGAGCKAALPDYKLYATLTGTNCSTYTITQTPVAGTFITVPNVANTVTMKATVSNGKILQTTFTVTMLDTITPKWVFTGPLATNIDTVMIEDLRIKTENLYSAADNMTEQLYKATDKVFPWSMYPGSGPSTQGYYDSSLFVTVSMKDLTSPTKDWKRFNSLAKYLTINPDTSYEHVTDLIDWSRLINVPDFTPTEYAIDYRDWYDWQADALYFAVPKKTLPTTPDLTKVKIASPFVPLMFDATANKLKFYNAGAWHTLTSN
jgi:hypothetical protein